MSTRTAQEVPIVRPRITDAALPSDASFDRSMLVVQYVVGIVAAAAAALLAFLH